MIEILLCLAFGPSPTPPIEPQGLAGPGRASPSTPDWQRWWSFEELRVLRAARPDSSNVPGRELVETTIVPALLEVLASSENVDIQSNCLLALGKLGEK